MQVFLLYSLFTVVVGSPIVGYADSIATDSDYQTVAPSELNDEGRVDSLDTKELLASDEYQPIQTNVDEQPVQLNTDEQSIQTNIDEQPDSTSIVAVADQSLTPKDDHGVLTPHHQNHDQDAVTDCVRVQGQRRVPCVTVGDGMYHSIE